MENKDTNNEEKMFNFDTNDDLPPSPMDSPRDKKPKTDLNTEHNDEIAKTGQSVASGSSQHQPFMVAASPPKFVSISDVMAAADGIGNMVLAHEIAVDDDFKIGKTPSTNDSNSLEARVTEMMRKAFWDVLQEKLDQVPPDYGHALGLLQEVKESLLGILMPQHLRLKTQIEEVMDMDLIKQKVEHDALDLHYYSDFVISTMSRLCAPARDDEVAKLKELTEIVPLFRGILETLDTLKIDMANYQIQHIRPYLRQQSMTYELKKFEEFLKKQKETGVDGLECTKSWLERSYLVLTYQNTSRENSGLATASVSTATVNHTSILNNAYIELLSWPENLLFPETLVMDQKRFAIQERQCNWLTLVTSVLLVTYSTAGAPIAGIGGLKEKLMQQITVLLKGVAESGMDEAMKSVAEQVNKEVCSCMEKHGFKALDEQRQNMLKSQIQAVRSADHVVHKLMKTRLDGFLKDLLVHADRPSETQIPPGFSSVSKELSHISGQFLRLVTYNNSVFGRYYPSIMDDILKKHRTEGEGTPV